RLDQLSALTLGGFVGAAVLGSREFRQRGHPLYGAVAGLLLGGAGAIAGISLLAFDHGVLSPRSFFLERAAAWALACGLTGVALGTFVRPHTRRMLLERAGLAVGGGAVGGILFTLPGATDLWQAVAFVWFGATIGVAVVGPELWSAGAVIEGLPARGRSLTLLALREWPLHDGVRAIGEARVSLVNGRVALYPPAGGVVADGRPWRRPHYLLANTDVAVGRIRYRVRVLGTPG
ncbi:MAG: hypothetical protein ACRELE_00365, partial [Gemmatimonadales bacterium]